MINRKHLLQAIARVDADIIGCQVGALPAFAHQLLGQAMALRFALGLSQQENRKQLDAVKRRSPYWLEKMLALHEKADDKR